MIMKIKKTQPVDQCDLDDILDFYKETVLYVRYDKGI